MNVEIRIEREEVESLEIALRALHAERLTLSRFGLHSGELSVAIDDLDMILDRVRAQRVQTARVEADPHSRKVHLLTPRVLMTDSWSAA